MARSKEQAKKLLKKKQAKKVKRAKALKTMRVTRMPNGDKVLHLDEKTSESLKQQKKLFVETFGREPGPNDPIFFDPDIKDKPTALSEEKVKKNIISALEASNAPKEIIYAFGKTGFIVTDFNKDQFSISEMKEWDDAVKEYQSQNPA